ncbi:hypothetical protein [Haloarchaeobius sp. DYHT-AS-18]|uniref:hypothetical protein n=1 Tax=Haloarchaeobius sp. DYHT-AS-18 TaxID=3446117 RepID=UPI003EBBFAF8
MSNRTPETRRHGMTVARDGVIVEKRLDVQTMPLPAVSFDIVSDRTDLVEVTLVEQLPPDLSADRLGFHPGFGAENWTCYGGGELVWRGRLAPDEHVQTVFGVWLDSPDRALSLLTSPTVEAIREVGEDTDPLVLDESFVATPDTGPTELKRAVEAAVPQEALRAESGLPQWSDLPEAGTDLTAPSREAVGEVVAAISGGTDVSAHDRYYHLRLSVETAGRGDREVSVLEDLTNALSVLYADADDRDDGAWRVLDVAIGTNWQAERIVTALGDDHRVSGLLVTELTGAVNSGDHDREPQSTSLSSGVSETDPVTAELASTVLFGESAATAGTAPEDAADEQTGSPEPTATEAAGAAASDTPSDPPTDAPSTASAGATEDDAPSDDFGAGAVDDFGGFEPAETTGSSAEEEPADEGTDEFGDAEAFENAFEFDDESSGFDTFEQADPEERAESEPDDAAAETSDDDDAASDSDDSMAVFAELKEETEQASVSDLDEELEDVVLSPNEEEEYSIADLLDDIDEEENTASPA